MSIVYKKTKGDMIADFIINLVLIAITIICFYPMWYAFCASISDPLELMKNTGILLKPLGFSLDGYKVVLNNPNIPVGYINTIVYVVAGTALNMILTTMGAYALSRKGYMLKKFFTIAIIFTMYFSGGLIPNYLLIKNLGLLDSRLAIILPVAIGTWNLIVMKTVFQNLPASLEESAIIDGANDFVVLFRIFIPISKATMAVMVLFYSVGHWNAWYNAMVYLQDRNLFPLQLILREVLISNSDVGNVAAGVASGGDSFFYLDELVRYATIIISTVPILCVYPFVQKYFIKGVMMGSLKE